MSDICDGFAHDVRDLHLAYRNPYHDFGNLDVRFRISRFKLDVYMSHAMRLRTRRDPFVKYMLEAGAPSQTFWQVIASLQLFVAARFLQER